MIEGVAYEPLAGEGVGEQSKLAYIFIKNVKAKRWPSKPQDISPLLIQIRRQSIDSEGHFFTFSKGIYNIVRQSLLSLCI